MTDLLERAVQCSSPRVSCLVDCGALITGFSNLEVAKFLMDDVKEEGFCGAFSACISWDESDAPMAFRRGGFAAVPLASCSTPMDKCFVYFDQVHTTGIDIKLPRDALAVVTIGSDTNLRDYVQACWRLRQFGEGQRVEVLLVPEIRRLVTKYTADYLLQGTPRAAVDEEFRSLEQERKVQRHGGLNAEDIYYFLYFRQEQQESIQRAELLHQQLRVWRRRRMQAMMGDAAFEQMDKCFFTEHDEKGCHMPLQEPSDSELTLQETEEKERVQNQLQGAGRQQESGLDAQSVRQKQQEKQKELAKETQQQERQDALTIPWKLSHLLSGDGNLFHRISDKFSDLLGFYPDYIFASSTFASALLHPQSKYTLPLVEAILEVKPEVSAQGGLGVADEMAGSGIVFITLQEADTMCRLLRMPRDDDLQQRISLYIIDSNGYCSDVVPCREPSRPCLDGHARQLACSPPVDVDRIIDSPSVLYQGLAFARLFNCNAQYDVFQATFILHGLQQWHSKQLASINVRDAVSASFSALAAIRGSKNDFNHSPFLMAATHSDLFVAATMQQRWCPASKLMLRVMWRIGALPASVDSSSVTEQGEHDVAGEVSGAVNAGEGFTEAIYCNF